MDTMSEKTEKTAPKKVAAFKPLKKGTAITFVTGSRKGQTTHTGTVTAFVAKGAEPKVSKKVAEQIGNVAASNRDRYLVETSAGPRFANVKSTTAV
jgi:hypothetical protein